jgi:hypothetical protein
VSGASYYRGIQGSRELGTAALTADEAVAAAEALAPGAGGAVDYRGVRLAAVHARGATVRLPLDAFDVLAVEQPPLEQAAYLHLLRLSYGEGLNFCRVGKRLLMARLHLSERRLNRVLDGLVRAGLCLPVHRNNDGTLYRVFLPAEQAREERSAACPDLPSPAARTA